MQGKLRSMTSLYLTGDQGILCLYRIGSKVVDHLYVGAAGGHFEPDEVSDARACVLREMQEELGLTEADIDALSLRYITLRLKNGEIRQNYYFFARLAIDRPLVSNEGTLRWVAPEEFPDLPMPVSAKQMILHYLKEGQFNDRLYAGVSEAESPDGIRFAALTEF